MRLAVVVAALLVAASAPFPVAAQQPQDTVAPVPPPGDTIVLPDSAHLVVVPDTLVGRPVAPPLPDSLFVPVLPEVDGRAPAGFVAGVWVFERADLLAMRGLTLADLLAHVPGVTRLRGGDYGAPETVTAFGLAGGGVRVFWDDFEQVPLDGSVTDLSLIGVGGLEWVRVERHPTELRIAISTLRDDDEPRPTSLIEAGTGDLDTNFFRGTFLQPRAFGGSLGLALDRVDTRGPNREEGTRTGGWLRYTRQWGEDFALTGEAKRMSAQAEIPGYPGEADRTDWFVRARWRPAPGLVVQGFTGRSMLEGRTRDGRLPVDRSRAQHGLAGDLVSGPVRVHGAARALGGNDLPSVSADLSATLDLPKFGGVQGSTSQELWDGATVGVVRVGGWTRAVLGLSLFGFRESGTRGVPLYPLPPELPEEGEEVDPESTPSPRFHERTATRVGVRFARGGLDLGVARVSFEADSLPLLGLPMDRGGAVLGGGERTGVEVAGRLPIPFAPDGFAFAGSALFWDEGARYLPERSYQAGFVFHDTFYPSGSLEVWASLGVEGRDPMTVPVGDPAIGIEPPTRVPFYQSWYGFIQARVQMVRIFVSWENFTVRRNNQDFPGRVLPITRATYGIRWTLFD